MTNGSGSKCLQLFPSPLWETGCVYPTAPGVVFLLLCLSPRSTFDPHKQSGATMRDVHEL